MKSSLINTLKVLLAIIVFPFALTAVVIFMLVTFGKMAVEKFIHRSASAR